MKIKNCSFCTILLFLLSSCAVVKSPAPIEYHHKNSNLGGVQEEVKTVKESEEVINPIRNSSDCIIPEPSPIKKNSKIIYHEVQIGETIEDIALKYDQTIDQIASLNNIYAPYELEEFQILKTQVPKGEETRHKPAATKSNTVVHVEDFIAPIQGTILSKFGEKTNYGNNKGINISAKQGTKVLASSNGKVIYADYDAIFGHLVIIKTDQGNVINSYAHLEDIVLSKGQRLNQGDIVGYVGKSGKVQKPQLHFGIRDGKVAKDPLQYIDAKNFK
ncbi:peptidoglycan DD-metalloendopeptidase family protein [Rickettsiaceae bacterium]|nr:peptidoglycan DD-metalloendopeptidase family protein [Rickettsiaceae bacterium]